MSCRPSETARKQLDRREVDPRLAAADGGFEILGKPAVAVQPREGSLDHPASRQDLKAGGLIGSLDDPDAPFPVPGERGGQLVTGKTAIGEDMAQPREQIADRGQQARRPVAILNVGGMDLCRHQMSRGVGDDVALAALDFFAGVKTARAAAFRRLGGLAIDHPGRRTGLPSRLDAGKCGSIKAHSASVMSLA